MLKELVFISHGNITFFAQFWKEKGYKDESKSLLCFQVSISVYKCRVFFKCLLSFMP